MSDGYSYYDRTDFEGSLEQSANIEENIENLVDIVRSLGSKLDSRVQKYYKGPLDSLEKSSKNLSDDVASISRFHSWLQEEYHNQQETERANEALANELGGGSGGGGSSGSGGFGGAGASAISPISSPEFGGIVDSETSTANGTTPSIASEFDTFGGSSDSSAAKAIDGLPDTSKSTNGGVGSTFPGSNGVAAGIGAAAGIGTAAGLAGGVGASTTTTGSSNSSGNISGQTYNGGNSGTNSTAQGEINRILGIDSDDDDDDDDDKKKDDIDISTDIAKDAKDKVDKIISKTKKVIPKLHSSEVGGSSGTGTSVAGVTAAGLGGLGVIGAVGGGLAYTNNNLNTDEDEDEDEDKDDDELGDYDKKDKDKSNENDESSNKDWLYGLGIGLGAAGVAKKIKDDKDKDKEDNENENSNHQ